MRDLARDLAAANEVAVRMADALGTGIEKLRACFRAENERLLIEKRSHAGFVESLDECGKATRAFAEALTKKPC